jgi:DNA (cytosine-5)-methyltransferase 1
MAHKKQEVNLNLFAGGGGFAVGMRLAGCSPKFVYEIDTQAQETLRGVGFLRQQPPGWAVHKGDVTLVNWTKFPYKVRVLAAGVPCQPFSLAGNHMAQKDSRNLFPTLLTAIRHLKPRAVIIENVPGLLRPQFRSYFEYVLRSLNAPALIKGNQESWRSHNKRLRKHLNRLPAEYTVHHAILNAADYGVPQIRKRLFIVAIRKGHRAFQFPATTHSRAILIRDKASGAYWRRHNLRPRTKSAREALETGSRAVGSAWVTVRDVIRLLPHPSRSENSSRQNGGPPNHWIIAGARSYSGHNGSELDWPSKTLKAGVHGVPGGENTVRAGNNRIRYYTLREAASVQSFPIDHEFKGHRLRATRQIGNAVPPLLAKAVLRSVMAILGGKRRR